MRRTLLVALTAGLVFVSGTAQAVGAPDPGFGTAGVVVTDLLDQTGPVDVDSAGRSVVLGVKSGSIAIARYLPNGMPDTSFSGNGRADVAIPVATRQSSLDVRVLADGSIVAMGYRTTDPMDPFSNGLWSAKVTSSGSPAAGYGTNGVSILEQGYHCVRRTGHRGRGRLGHHHRRSHSVATSPRRSRSTGQSLGTLLSGLRPVRLPRRLCLHGESLPPTSPVRVSSDAIHPCVAPSTPFNCGLDGRSSQSPAKRRRRGGLDTCHRLSGGAFCARCARNPIALVGSDVLVATVDGADVATFTGSTRLPAHRWPPGALPVGR